MLTAATELFSTQGWAVTSVRDVANAAGISVETVYSALGSKILLLLARVDVDVVGDDTGLALAERSEFVTGRRQPARSRLRCRAARHPDQRANCPSPPRPAGGRQFRPGRPLTETFCWSPQQYETWLGETILRLVAPHADAFHDAHDEGQRP